VSRRRAGFLRASLTEERADLSRYPRVFLVLAVVGDEVAEYSAALEPFLRETPALARGCLKGRRTEIDAMNGYIARKGAEVGLAAPSHVKLAGIVTRIERGELKPAAELLRS